MEHHENTCSAFLGTTNYCSKNHRKFSGGANYHSKVQNKLSCTANYRSKSARSGTTGVTKMRGNFLEILFQAKFLPKAKKSQEFCQNLFALLLHNTVICAFRKHILLDFSDKNRWWP